MIQFLKLVYSDNTIKTASLQTCLQTNYDMSFSEPKRDPVIGLGSLCRNSIKLHKQKINNNHETLYYFFKKYPQSVCFCCTKTPILFCVFSKARVFYNLTNILTTKQIIGLFVLVLLIYVR